MASKIPSEYVGCAKQISFNFSTINSSGSCYILSPCPPTEITAISRAEKEMAGKSIALYDLRFLKPLDEEMLHEIGQRFSRIITVEDGVLEGGMGSAVLEFMADNGYKPAIKRLGIPDRFIPHGTVKELRNICGIDKESIYHTIIHTLSL